ncbi:MAG: thermostable hemolysin [Sneathiella sp.]
MLQVECIEDGQSIGQLVLRNANILRLLKGKPSIISIVTGQCDERNTMEAFISDIYRTAYNADIKVTYPYLLGVLNDTGDLIAAAGFRPASDGPLFLETYLTDSVDKLLVADRKKIVEIGNLASNGKGASLFLFAAISAYLYHHNYQYAVATGTDFLERRFQQIGLKPRRLGQAFPLSETENDDNWGSYYLTRPHVLSGSVSDGYAQLQHQLGVDFSPGKNLPRLNSQNEEAQRNVV